MRLLGLQIILHRDKVPSSSSGSSLTGPLNSSCTGFSPRWKSSSTPRSAKPLNRSMVVGDGCGDRLA
jgi:hypothetical protein